MRRGTYRKGRTAAIKGCTANRAVIITPNGQIVPGWA